jgi:hypothetical protein
MPTYRYPTAILWAGDGQGYKRLVADTAEDAVAACPRSDIGLCNMQVQTAQGFEWVENVPRHLGGIDMGRRARP